MGTDNNSDVLYYAVADDGTTTPLASVTTTAVGTMEPDEWKAVFTPGNIELSLSLPKSLRCRTAKRFKKKLMSIGISRNDAESAVYWMNERRKLTKAAFSYQQEWIWRCFIAERG